MKRNHPLWILLLTSLFSQLIFASDLCLSTATLPFKEKERNLVCRSEVPALLNLELDFKGVFGPFPFVDTEGREQILNNCQKYLQYVPHFGGVCTSRADCWAEYSVYMRSCGTLYAVERAKKPAKTYLGNNPLSFKILPSIVLPNGPTTDNYEEVERATAQGESSESFLQSLATNDKEFDRNKYLTGWKPVLLARADFDSDGIEDALVSFSFVYDRYLGYRMGILQRLSNRGPAKWVNFDEFKWAEPIAFPNKNPNFPPN